MKPVVTPDEMRKIDATAPVEESVLIQRAGWAVAQAAIRMMNGTYGRRVAVVAGKGNNGADGRVAADLLKRRGIGVSVFSPGQPVSGRFDLMIDAAFGIGFHGSYEAPHIDAPVLAIDVPSGVNGLTGEACDGAVRAARTITFAALKPGLLLGQGPELAGEIEVADIGIDATASAVRLIEASDLSLLPKRGRDAHKWESAVVVVAGSPGMMGAATFAVGGAQRAGAGMVRLASPGVAAPDLPIGEAVALEIPSANWAEAVVEASDRAKAIVVGPGLGRDPQTIAAVRDLLTKAELPVLVDGDALFALSEDQGGVEFLKQRKAPTVLTPHDGEFKRLAGHAPSVDRIDDVKQLARKSGAVVLLKGTTTVVADSDGRVSLSVAGSSRLGTAGTGDVLSGVIGAFLARGAAPIEAAALGAFVHGSAATLGYEQGLIAGDLPDLVAEYLSSVS